MASYSSKIQRICLLACFLTLAALYIYQAHFFWDYVNDDAYISLRYSRNISNGLGPYYNADEHVEGYTNFAWTILMALVIRGLGPAGAPLAAKALGVIFGAATILVTFLVFKTAFTPDGEDDPPLAADIGALIAAGILCVNPAFALNSASGLETTMFAFFLMLGVFLALKEERKQIWMGSGLAFGVAVLTRPEGIALAGVYLSLSMAMTILRNMGGCSWSVSEIRRVAAQSRVFRLQVGSALIVIGVFVFHLLFRLYFYDGEWLPNTYYAKAGGFWGTDPWTYVYKGLIVPVFGIIGIAISAIGFLYGRRRAPRRIVPLAAMAVCGASMPFLEGTDWMVGWRLAIQYLPLFAILVAAGWTLLFTAIPERKMWILPLIAVVGLGVLWLNYGRTREEFFGYIEMRAYGYETGHASLANWLTAQPEPWRSVALMDIGIVGYVCADKGVLDLTGLTDRYIAKSEGGFLRKVYPTKYILDRKPEFIALTLSAPGTSYEPPAQGTVFGYWTSIEARLAEDPEFQKLYVNKRPTPNSSNWLDNFACQIGAERIFEHGHPGCYFLLAVFKRKAQPR
jgi:arabinofuranosyltransferase